MLAQLHSTTHTHESAHARTHGTNTRAHTTKTQTYTKKTHRPKLLAKVLPRRRVHPRAVYIPPSAAAQPSSPPTKTSRRHAATRAAPVRPGGVRRQNLFHIRHVCGVNGTAQVL